MTTETTSRAQTADGTERVEIPPRFDLRRHAAGPVYQAMLRFAQAAEGQGLERSLIELVKIRASQINGCAYCIDMHTLDALAAGETQRRLFAISAWRESPLFDDRER